MPKNNTAIAITIQRITRKSLASSSWCDTIAEAILSHPNFLCPQVFTLKVSSSG